MNNRTNSMNGMPVRSGGRLIHGAPLDAITESLNRPRQELKALADAENVALKSEARRRGLDPGTILARLGRVALLCLTVASAWAGNVTLQWDANTNATVAGYTVHLGGAPGVYTNHIFTTNTTLTLSNLAAGTYFVAASTRDTNGLDGDLTAPISFYLAPAPSGFRIRLSLQAAVDPAGPWVEMPGLFAVIDPLELKQFYRGLVGIGPAP